MGHCIQAFIGNKNFLEAFTKLLNTSNLSIEKLPQNYYLIYITETIGDVLYKKPYKNNIFVNEFSCFFNSYIFSKIKNINFNNTFIYIETDYFGGYGSQGSIIFKNKEILAKYFVDTESMVYQSEPYPINMYNMPINKALRSLGVCSLKDRDEFDTLRLGDFRKMPDNS